MKTFGSCLGVSLNYLLMKKRKDKTNYEKEKRKEQKQVGQ